ncbi:hypothetical protein ACKWTF_001224 [Chironomus riparius]
MNPLNLLTGIVDHVIVSPISSVIEGISEATCAKNHKPRSVDDFSYDLENWMKKLPDSIRDNVPIINLAIPGTHNSGSYAINSMSAIAPDADGSTPGLHKAFPKRICCWAKTQEYTFKQQLVNGIRYFDLRLAPKGDDIYFVHGVYSTEVTNPLKEISEFLKSHPNEFVFLDCQKFYKFELHHHEKFKAMLLSLFGDVMFSSPIDLPYLTLSKADDLQKQVVVIYRNNPNCHETFFKSGYFPNPWANVTSTEKLKDFLDNKIKSRNPDTAYCTQLILTPDGNYIAARFHLSLKNTCSRHVMKDLGPYLKSQTPGPFVRGEASKINVIIADFVEQDNNFFTRTVVDLNMKLLSLNFDGRSSI